MDMVQEGLNARSPKNKKQIGRVGKKDKIYIEDYAVTYLHQIARSTEHKSGFAGLFGTCREVEGTKEYYIYAAVYQESENVPSGGLPRTGSKNYAPERRVVFGILFLGMGFYFGRDCWNYVGKLLSFEVRNIDGKAGAFNDAKANDV